MFTALHYTDSLDLETTYEPSWGKVRSLSKYVSEFCNSQLNPTLRTFDELSMLAHVLSYSILEAKNRFVNIAPSQKVFVGDNGRMNHSDGIAKQTFSSVESVMIGCSFGAPEAVSDFSSVNSCRSSANESCSSFPSTISPNYATVLSSPSPPSPQNTPTPLEIALNSNKNTEEIIKCLVDSTRATQAQQQHTNKRKRMKLTNPVHRECAICKETNTPEWRKGPEGTHTLCNACGLNFAKKMKQERQNLERQGYRKESIDSMLNVRKFRFKDLIKAERIARKKPERNKIQSITNFSDVKLDFNNCISTC